MAATSTYFAQLLDWVMNSMIDPMDAYYVQFKERRELIKNVVYITITQMEAK